ncbi:MAG: extracellular solute-binding protein [Proteobacteria bacterium]|nr:extracellular solute-binding protein [Pseudomonadota bacterium]
MVVMRRGLIHATIAATLIVAGAAPGRAADERLEGTLRVATWGGSWLQFIQANIEPRLKARGATIEYVLGNPHENLAKLIAARGQKLPFDMIEFSEHNRNDLVEAGVLAALSYADIPNAQSLEARDRLPSMVANSSTVDGIVYNAKKLAELGVAPPKTYAELANPKLAGRVSFPDATIIQGIKGIIAVAYENGGDEKHLGPGLDAISRLNVGAFFTSSVKLFAQFKAGDVWAAHWHVGWVERGRKDDLPLAVSLPAIKDKRGVLSNVWLGVIRGTPNEKAANAYINAYLAPDVQEQFGRLIGARPVNQQAADRLMTDPALADLLPLTREAYAAMYFPDLTAIDLNDLLDQWKRKVIRRPN